MDLVSALRAAPRDSATWRQFVEKVYPAMMYVAFRLTNGDRELAQDIVQESFLRFLRLNAVERLNSDDEAIAYLRQTVRHLVIDHRRLNTRLQSIDDVGELLDVSISAAADEMLAEDLTKLAERFSEEDRGLLALVIEGYSTPEIADRLGIPYSAVAVRLHRLRKRLRLQMGVWTQPVKKPPPDRL